MLVRGAVQSKDDRKGARCFWRSGNMTFKTLTCSVPARRHELSTTHGVHHYNENSILRANAIAKPPGSSSYVFMSSPSSDSWLALLDEKRQGLNPRASKIVLATKDENAFRIGFEEIGNKRGEKYTTRFLMRLSPTFENVIGFADAVAEPIPYLPSDALRSFVWGISLALIKEGSRTKTKLEYLVKLLSTFNGAVPKFEPQNSPYAEDPDLQKPLQTFFSVYVDSIIYSLAEISRESVLSSAVPFSDAKLEAIGRESTRKHDEAKQQYEKAIEEEEQRRKENRYVTLNEDRQKGKSRTYELQMSFEFSRELGRGSFSQVDEVKEFSTTHLYACKRVYLSTEVSSTPNGLLKVAQDELNSMRKLRHHHIASVLFGNQGTDHYNIFMVPVADCNLRQYLESCTKSNYGPAEINPIFQWFGCVLNALNHAHKLSIKHRDIKPSNILIKDKIPYLADFGLARDFSDQDSSFSEASMVEGTPQYFAPEYQSGGKYGRSADVFAMGCVFSEMLTVANSKSLSDYKNWRRPPQATHGSSAFRDSLPKVREWLLQIPKNKLNDILVHETLLMLHQDPEQRPRVQDCVNHLHRDPAFFCKVCK